MVLSQILRPSCIKVPLKSKDKRSAISELVDLLNDNGLLINKDEALEAILAREQTRSTGIGSGIACHTANAKLSESWLWPLESPRNRLTLQALTESR